MKTMLSGRGILVPCWKFKNIYYFGEVIGHAWYCSVCNYIGMSYSNMIQEFRLGRSYEKPNYKYCPGCGVEMREE